MAAWMWDSFVVVTMTWGFGVEVKLNLGFLRENCETKV